MSRITRLALFGIVVAIVIGGIGLFVVSQMTPAYVTGDTTGYTFFTIQPLNRVYLVDSQGRLVHEWEVSGPGRDAHLRENGNIVVSVEKQNPIPEEEDYTSELRWIGIDGRIEEYTWDGELVWAYEFDRPGYRIHHGIEIMPNGNVMFIAFEKKTVEEALAAGRDPENMGDGMWTDVFLEYDPQADEIVWEWHAWDHLIQDFDETQENYGVVEDNPQLVDVNFNEPAETIEDWLHANSIDYHPELDQVAFSVREFNEVWVIDHSLTTEEAAGPAGDILYRWGNPKAYRRGDDSNRYLYYQHDVQWIPEGYPGAGNMIAYVNRNPLPEPNPETGDEYYSSVVEWEVPLQEDGTYAIEDGQPFVPVDPVWSYGDGEQQGSIYSRFISGTQRLQNGNTLIIVGQRGHLLEVTPDKEIVWEYHVPYPGVATNEELVDVAAQIFKAKRFEADFPAFEGRDMTPGDTLDQLEPVEMD